MKLYILYILSCADGSLYTGITTDIIRRLSEHNTSEKWAKYTRARRPVEVVYTEAFNNRSDASKREYTIKQLSRKEKLALIQKFPH